jgi:hypothetical protein
MPAQRKKGVTAPQPVKKNQTYVYKLLDGGGIVSIIPSKGVTVYDESKNEVREIRYCPNQKSIFVDEQSGAATREPIKFYEWLLAVPHTKPNLIAFMEAHPSNTANGGRMFELVDTEKKNEESVEQEFLIHDAIMLIREKSAEDELLNIAKSNPKEFISSFDNPVVAMKAKLTRAADFGLIKLNESGAYWADGNRLIVATPTGYSSLNTLTQHCLTDKGASTFAKIESELDKINQ